MRLKNNSCSACAKNYLCYSFFQDIGIIKLCNKDMKIQN